MSISKDIVSDIVSDISTDIIGGVSYNSQAQAYADTLESSHGVTVTAGQLQALSDFFDARDAETWGSKLKDLRLFGFQDEGAARQSAINLSWVGSWTTTNPDFANAGYGICVNGDNLDVSGDFTTPASAGLSLNDQGCFISMSNVTRQGASYVQSYNGSTQAMEIKQSSGETIARFGSNALTGNSEIRDGVWVGSRIGGNTRLHRRISSGMDSQTNSPTAAAGSLATAQITYLTSNTAANVSSIGLIGGLSEAEAAEFTLALRTLCVSLGHTALP